MYREESAQLIEYKTFCRDNSRWNKKSSTAEKAVLLLLEKPAGMGAEGTHAGRPVKCNPAVPDIKIQTFVRLYGRLRIVYNKIYIAMMHHFINFMTASLSQRIPFALCAWPADFHRKGG